MQIIGVMGLIGSGKGAVAEYLVNKQRYTKMSFADPVKDATAGMFGWDRAMLQGDTPDSRAWREEKDEFWSKVLERPFSPRIALQEMGTEVGRNYFHPDLWLSNLEFRINNIKTVLGDEATKIVIDDCRFPNEIDLIWKLGGKTLVVHRGDNPEWWQIAYDQNSDQAAEDSPRMERAYKSIHPSEWKWISKKTYDNSIIIENDEDLERLYKSLAIHFA